MSMIAALDFHHRGRARPSRFVAKIARALRLADGFRWCDMGKAGADVEPVMSIPLCRVEPLEWRWWETPPARCWCLEHGGGIDFTGARERLAALMSRLGGETVDEEDPPVTHWWSSIGDRVTDFQIGDRVKLAGTEFEGVVIGKSYGDIRYEVRCDNGLYMRELLPEALFLIEEPT